MMMLNISGYKFVRLDALPHWQALCRKQCEALSLKGTVVWSTEGINVMLAGSNEAVYAWITWLGAFSEFSDIQYKFSESTTQPFGKMLVKIKKALVPGNVDPQKENSPAISPQKLKHWYESQRDFTIIDTRNDYELQAGKFERALDLKLDHFSEFSEKIASLPESLKQKPLVVYCTGGIRCEKAAPLAKRAGFKEVYQLEGGILKYFEECGNAFYEGECYVFDKRGKLNQDLNSS